MPRLTIRVCLDVEIEIPESAPQLPAYYADAVRSQAASGAFGELTYEPLDAVQEWRCLDVSLVSPAAARREVAALAKQGKLKLK